MKVTGSDRYQLENLPKLESYVDEQVSSGTYNLDANLALLRFYQFQPQAVQISVLAKVLLKALMQLPQPDFKICIHLVPEKIQADERIAAIINLAQALETTKFAEFWTQAGAMREIIDLVPGFYDAARNFMLYIIGITFARVTTKVLADSIKVEGKSLTNLIEEKKKTAGWTVNGDIIVLPKNNYNQVVVKRGVETIKFAEVSSVLDAITCGY